MKKSVKKLLLVALGAMGVAASQVSLADTATCNGNNCSAGPIAVSFSIVIPTFLRFEIGAAAGAPSVAWNASITAANIGNSTPVNADASTNAGPGAGAGELYYALLTNNGSTATISAVGTAAAFVSGGNSIPYSDVTALVTPSTGSGVALPPAGGSTVVPAAASGVINEAGVWTFQYANTATPAAGTYSGTINYTVAQP
jgi:hypothetical protein